MIIIETHFTIVGGVYSIYEDCNKLHFIFITTLLVIQLQYVKHLIHKVGKHHSSIGRGRTLDQ